MDRKTAIEWIEQIKHRISGGDEDFDRQRKEALDMAITDMKICEVNNAGWISVKDRLPEEKGEYLTAYHQCYWDNVDYHIVLIDKDTWRGKTTWAKKKYHRVTHYMPLPEPPKEG